MTICRYNERTEMEDVQFSIGEGIRAFVYSYGNINRRVVMHYGNTITTLSCRMKTDLVF